MIHLNTATISMSMSNSRSNTKYGEKGVLVMSVLFL